MIALDVSTSRLSRDDDRQPCCGRRLEHCDCDAPPAEVNNAREKAFTFNAGDARTAIHEKSNACEKLSHMAYAVMNLVDLRGQISWIKITDWLCLRADLTEPRTAVELAAQWREQK